MTEPRHTTIDGAHGDIVIHEWPIAEPTWIAALVHGYGEHLGRYPYVADHLNAAGAFVIGPDHEGHGLSDGERVLIDDFETVVDDVDAVVSIASRTHAGLPIVMVGHSLGGMIAARYAQRYGDRLTALVLSGPVIGSWEATAVADLPEIPDEPLDVAVLSRDPAIGEAYAADPLVWHGPFKRPMLRAIDAMLDTINHGGDLGDLPTLWVHGGADRLVPIGPSRTGVEQIGGANMREIVYADARHEVFNETNRDDVLNDVVGFVNTST